MKTNQTNQRGEKRKISRWLYLPLYMYLHHYTKLDLLWMHACMETWWVFIYDNERETAEHERRFEDKENRISASRKETKRDEEKMTCNWEVYWRGVCNCIWSDFTPLSPLFSAQDHYILFVWVCIVLDQTTAMKGRQRSNVAHADAFMYRVTYRKDHATGRDWKRQSQGEWTES